MDNDKRKLVKLVTLGDSINAHMLVGALATEGIPALIHNENMSTLFSGLSVMGVDVFVYEDVLEAAKAVMNRQNDQEEDI